MGDNNLPTCRTPQMAQGNSLQEILTGIGWFEQAFPTLLAIFQSAMKAFQSDTPGITPQAALSRLADHVDPNKPNDPALTP